MSTIYEQSIIPIDDTMAEDLIVSCCTCDVRFLGCSSSLTHKMRGVALDK